MKRFILYLTSTVVLLIIISSNKVYDSYPRIKGDVESMSREKIVWAVIQLYSQSNPDKILIETTSDYDGSFLIAPLKRDKYKVVLVRYGYEIKIDSLIISENKDYIERFRLKKLDEENSPDDSYYTEYIDSEYLEEQKEISATSAINRNVETRKNDDLREKFSQ